MKKYEAAALGEVLIDFTESGLSAQGNPLLEENPGGAPCNVLAMLAGLGHRTAFIGKVGRDMFGVRLKETLDSLNIDTRNLLVDENAKTTLAFVHTGEGGERDFSFYRNPGADMMLEAAEIDPCIPGSTEIFHFGTLSMTHEGVKRATLYAVETAKKNGALISFDPNLRPPLWRDLEEARRQTACGMAKCDILKISDNEIKWFTGEDDFDKGVERLQEEYNIPLILLSLGKEGSRAYYKELRVDAKPFLNDKTVETTGAGDTFVGCCLHFVLKYGLAGLDEAKLKEMLVFANAAASIITTRKGALRVMPAEEEIKKLMEQNP